MGLGELDVLNYVAMTAAVQEFKHRQLQLSAFYAPATPERTDGGDAFMYDILKADRDVAAPKAAGAPSKRVPLLPAGQVQGRCIHVGEHKFLSGNLLSGLRAAGSRQRNSQQRLGQELFALDLRQQKLRELAFALMLTGTMAIAEDDVIASVDYKVDSTHKPTAGTSWAMNTTDIPADLDTWIDLIESDSGFDVAHAWVNRSVMRMLMNNTKVKEFLGTADYRAQVGKAGYIVNFHGPTWHVYTNGYIPAGGSFTRFIADNKVILTPEPGPEWENIVEGSTQILPLGETQLQEVWGKHAYTVLESDPAGYKSIVGDTFIPKLGVPDAIVYADVTPGD